MWPSAWPGQLEHRPAVQLASLVQQLGVAREADERGERVALLDQLARDRLGDAVRDEPVGDPLRPVRRAPDALALRVVERALVDGGAGLRGCGLGAADVVGMEVRDRDPLDRRARATAARSRPMPGVEQRAVDEVAVNVARPRRQRQRDPPDACVELCDGYLGVGHGETSSACCIPGRWAPRSAQYCGSAGSTCSGRRRDEARRRRRGPARPDLTDAGTVARARADEATSCSRYARRTPRPTSRRPVGDFGGVFVDANAISPATTRRIGAGFARFVDGGIVGGPPSESYGPRLYLSGARRRRRRRAVRRHAGRRARALRGASATRRR